MQSGAPNPICSSGRCSIPEVEKGVALARKLRKRRVGLRIQAAPPGCCSTQKVDRVLLEAQSSRCASKRCSSQIVELL
ncbi:hypothetical protein OIU79_003197 [Salix purpurea]|uniref:Uncharacterized protein n=1 Tax=Salix purpurea TaxID=77065 RepID=A0A9Q0UKW9_SALPP|nr:hypothetical protein OIU79_003197 [Salix purpurea]